jgi:hypothetical protein
MNAFNHANLAILGGLEDLSLRITSGQQTTLTSISWFNAYKTSEFPEVVCDKTYFFLYSTDHDAGSGGINWGKGDNLDLTDFVEVAQIFNGYQAETPKLIRVPLAENPDTEVLHLFYHTNSTDPENEGIQQTRLKTSEGGAELHLMTWVDRGNPLGVVTGENHTGYFMPYLRGVNDWIGVHITKGGLPQPWFFSTSTDGRTWARGSQIDTIQGTENGYFAQLSEGKYFNYLNEQWWIGQIHPETGGLTDADRLLIIAKSDSDYNTISQQAILNNQDENIRYSVYIDTNNKAHVYLTNPVSKLYHGVYDLENLNDFI